MVTGRDAVTAEGRRPGSHCCKTKLPCRPVWCARFSRVSQFAGNTQAANQDPSRTLKCHPTGPRPADHPCWAAATPMSNEQRLFFPQLVRPNAFLLVAHGPWSMVHAASVGVQRIKGVRDTRTRTVRVPRSLSTFVLFSSSNVCPSYVIWCSPACCTDYSSCCIQAKTLRSRAPVPTFSGPFASPFSLIRNRSTRTRR